MTQRHIGTLLDRKAINDINDNFTELYNEYVGAGMDAAEAREKAEQAVADALFAKSTAVEAKDTADLTREEMIAIIREQTEGGDIVPEVVQARGTHNTVGERLNSISQDLAQSIDLVSDYTLYPQSPKPEKKGIKSKSPKIIHKTNENELQIIQRTNKGYAHYTFAKNIGASNPDRDYGQNHELIRIIRARQVQDAYVYFDMGNHLTGSLPVHNPEGNYNTAESLLFRLQHPDNEKNLSSKGTAGMAIYTLGGGLEASYNIQSSNASKGNVLFYCSAGGSNEVQILVNDVIATTFNPRAFTVAGSQSMAIIEFDIPIKATGTDSFKLTVKNLGSGSTYPCAINFYKLADYSGQVVDNYKAFGSSKVGWIENNGASDYALYDHDAKKWFGSYHGGEISEYERILWNSNSIFERNDYDLSNAQFGAIPVGQWRVQSDFKIYQQTSLANGKAKMVSEFDFNTDGTLEMDFGYFNGTVNLSTFYTALTCTSTPFSYIFHPVFHNLPPTPTNTAFSVETTEGKVSQVSSTDLLQLDIRFTKFNNHHDRRGVVIADNAAYRKLYYGPIYGTVGVPLKSLSFSKGLDFIVR